MGKQRPATPAADARPNPRPRRPGPRAAVAGAVAIAALAAAAFQWNRARTAGLAANEARALIAAGSFDEAGGPIGRWLAISPDDPEARFLAAKRAIGLGRIDEGMRGLDTARTLGYSADAVDRERGLILARAGRLDDAEPILRKQFKRAGEAGLKDADVDEALARCYVETFQLRAAETVLARWIVDAPDDARPYYWKADIEARKPSAEPDALIALYEQVVRLDPSHEKGRRALAEQYLQTHRYDDAAAQYEALREARPDDVEAILGLGRVAADRGEDDEAAQLLDRAAEVAPKDSRPLSERGKLEMKRGRFEAALGYFDRAVALDAEEPDVHYQRSLVLTWLGREEDARKARDETARLKKEKAEIDAILESLRKSPRDAAIQYAAAKWLVDHGHEEEGLKWAEKNVQDHPSHAETHRLLADYYRRRGDVGLANFHQFRAGDR